MCFNPTTSIQTPLPSSSSPGGRWGRGEEHNQQHVSREPQPGGGGRSGRLLTPAPAAVCWGGRRRGLLWAFGWSEQRQHHGFGLGHVLLSLLLVPRQRGPLWKQWLCLPGQWNQVSGVFFIHDPYWTTAAESVWLSLIKLHHRWSQPRDKFTVFVGLEFFGLID